MAIPPIAKFGKVERKRMPIFQADPKPAILVGVPFLIMRDILANRRTQFVVVPTTDPGAIIRSVPPPGVIIIPGRTELQANRSSNVSLGTPKGTCQRGD